MTPFELALNALELLKSYDGFLLSLSLNFETIVRLFFLTRSHCSPWRLKRSEVLRVLFTLRPISSTLTLLGMSSCWL
jgi:hypothetical protein